MDDVIVGLVVERLDADALDDEAQYLVLAACEGDDELTAALGGSPPARPEVTPPQAAAAEPPGAYLGSLSVEGFRGIGERAELALKPGVGLTLVVGRNGSGKSSFAEALEVLLTGDNQRWAARTKIWKEGWPNLHHAEQRRIAATFVVEGRGEVEAIRSWDADASDITTSEATAQAKGKPRGTLDDLAWSAPLTAYRPFLSYNELGRMLEEGPSYLYDALASILGLEELVVAHERLGTERRAREKRKKDAAATLKKEILPLLEGNDEERAATVAELLAEREPDLDRVAALVTGAGSQDDDDSLHALRRLVALTPPITLDGAAELADELRAAARRSESVAETAGVRARDTVGLLEGALTFHERHGDGDCPVCLTQGVLDAGWRAASEQRLETLRREAEEASAAHGAAAAARERLRRALGDPEPVARDAESAGLDAADAVTVWRAWTTVPDDATLEGLAGHVESHAPDLVDVVEGLRAAATDLLDQREDAWRPVAARIAGWVEEMRQATIDAVALPTLQVAEDWLKDATAAIRTERFAPIATKTKDIWSTLRAQSNVDLVDIVLTGSSTQRRVELQVDVDGIEGAALGVMSQGELHSLALALFFPRATLAESPFRFVVIDDPVQSMDPVRVDGLARVLEQIATSRQVIVFTHDDRLADSVRHLGIEATTFEVTRRAGSIVEVRETLDPITRYLDDAWALLSTRELPEEAARRVVPGFCRMALEAAFLMAFRRRRLREGASHADVERAVEAANKASKKAALGLHGDIERTGDVMSGLNTFGGWAGDLFKELQKGSHTTYEGDLEKLVRNTRDLSRKVLEKHG